jgi:hypothetical protein
MIYTDITDIENHIKLWMMIVIYQRLKNTIKTEIKKIVLDYQNLNRWYYLKNESSDSLLNRLSEFKIDIIERYLKAISHVNLIQSISTKGWSWNWWGINKR